MEFHISRRARDKYQFDETLFAYDGNVIFANFYAARKFVQKINGQRDLATFPEQAAKTSHVNAMGLIDEIFHHVFKLYREQKNPLVLNQLLNHLEESVPSVSLDHLLGLFIRNATPLWPRQPVAHKNVQKPRHRGA